ncbi:TB2/DP1/HVA22-related protein [Carpediemonas membranifera]|uniref:TB2/DP1/HVA22-related protein n=1 Tax=Carpediemonas membranifera TaxID=201153 RepID=A0A8J6E4P0_9EUKA|nr:TB2/DP1/HVA22-related protein [Carpediemonas membranifera]|eukprot:KAG9394747.1 TB2/DP1/HVA22-related protein [Carpediemonas membranifera]
MLDWLTQTLFYGICCFYPALQTRALLKGDRIKGITSFHKYLTYWTVIGIILTIEKVFDTILQYLPLYGFMKLLFGIWMFFPDAKGAQFIYSDVIDPALVSVSDYFHTRVLRFLLTFRQPHILIGGLIGRVLRAKDDLLTSTAAGLSTLEEIHTEAERAATPMARRPSASAHDQSARPAATPGAMTSTPTTVRPQHGQAHSRQPSVTAYSASDKPQARAAPVRPRMPASNPPSRPEVTVSSRIRSMESGSTVSRPSAVMAASGRPSSVRPTATPIIAKTPGTGASSKYGTMRPERSSYKTGPSASSRNLSSVYGTLRPNDSTEERAARYRTRYQKRMEDSGGQGH